VVIVKYPGGKTATIDVCRQAPYGYDQRAEVGGREEGREGGREGGSMDVDAI